MFIGSSSFFTPFHTRELALLPYPKRLMRHAMHARAIRDQTISFSSSTPLFRLSF